MGLSAVFKVFKNSFLITSNGGEIEINRVFPTSRAAKKAHYRYFRTDNGTRIYTSRTGSGLQKYAVIGC